VPSIIRPNHIRRFVNQLAFDSGRSPSCRAHPLPTEMRTGMLPPGSHGFTLIELIIVTALIAIMLAVAIPRLERGLFSDAGDQTARWIIVNVRELKEKAIADQKTYLLNVSLDTHQLWISTADTSDADEAAAQKKAYHLPKGMSIDDVAFSQNEHYSSGIIPIHFYAAGYSDKVVIQMSTKDGDHLSFFIHPFLPQVDYVRGDQG
jgi:prepilin-type N-terminal cleavage/methylation domain-containing protein